jgi:N-acetylglucosamine-6-phosphate deacetylase
MHTHTQVWNFEAGRLCAMSLFCGDQTLYQFKNCRILRHGRLLDSDEALWVREGRVQDPKKIFWDEKRTADVTIDCGGLIASPGFIDLQINGKTLVKMLVKVLDAHTTNCSRDFTEIQE